MALTHVLALPEQTKVQSWLKETLVVLGASILIALCAPLSIRLPFSSVPIATQLHVILFLAVTLGSKRSAAAVLSYLMYGALGLPVFAGGGAGFLTLLGPTGGYLLGYALAAFVTGYLCERARECTLITTLAALVVGNLLVFFTGSLWLSGFVGGIVPALTLGVLPFIPADALKTVLVLKALKKV